MRWDRRVVGIGGSSIGGAVWDVKMLSGVVVTLTDDGVPLGRVMGGLCGGTMRISCLLRQSCLVGVWTM